MSPQSNIPTVRTQANLTARLLLMLLLPVCLGLLMFGIAGYQSLQREDYQNRSQMLSKVVSLAAAQLEDLPLTVENADSVARAIGAATGLRVTVLAINGRVLSDYYADARLMDNHADRPEVKSALKTGYGEAIRVSTTLNSKLHYAACRLDAADGRSNGVIRVALALVEAPSPAAKFVSALIWLGLIALAMTTIIALWAARHLSSRLAEALQGVRQFTDGDLRHRVPQHASSTFAELAGSLNAMAENLDIYIREIRSERDELLAVLGSMVEGVVAVDADERIIRINRAAAQALRVDEARVLGRTLAEVVRMPELQQFATRVLESRRFMEGEVVIDAGERYMQVHGVPLKNPGGGLEGVLIVLNDITRLRKLESVRRDFAANVSHELRTPITSIKGYVETLRESHPADPDATKKFLDVIARQADRLNGIIEDLLSLARIEQSEESKKIDLTAAPLKPVIERVLESRKARIAASGLTVSHRLDEGITARINPPLLEQALGNLLDNAIAYNKPQGSIEVRMEKSDTGVLIKVADTGMGMEARHLARIFERFYRVDPDRSRKIGGTGLGLAIVKHIAQAHRGSVTVTSTPGKGSEFTIHLPLSES